MPTSHPSGSYTAPGDAPAGAPGSRAIPAAMLVLALAGLGVALYLWDLYHRVRAGADPSFCDLSARWSCSDVALSKYAAFLGVPQAAWGALSYATVAGLAVSALGRGRPSPSWPGGLLAILTALMAAWSVALALISELVIGKFCYMCATSWGITFALLALSLVLVRRAGGLRAALRADVAAIRARAVPSAVAGGVAAAAALALLAGYASAGTSPGPVTRDVIPMGPPGSLVVYEYSDYLCPHCGFMHGEEPAIRAARPDVRFVRRHFPLDATCNRAVSTTVHEGACDLARGGICAERQGRFEAYDDAAFASQQSRAEPEELAARVGLDVEQFRQCMAATDTQQRLAADVQSGLDLHVQGTPSFLVQGKLVSSEQLLRMLGVPAK